MSNIQQPRTQMQIKNVKSSNYEKYRTTKSPITKDCGKKKYGGIRRGGGKPFWLFFIRGVGGYPRRYLT